MQVIATVIYLNSSLKIQRRTGFVFTEKSHFSAEHIVLSQVLLALQTVSWLSLRSWVRNTVLLLGTCFKLSFDSITSQAVLN